MPRYWNPDAPTPLVSLTGLKVRINKLRNKLRPHIDAAKEVVEEIMQDLYEDLGYFFSRLAALAHDGTYEQDIYDGTTI